MVADIKITTLIPGKQGTTGKRITKEKGRGKANGGVFLMVGPLFGN